MLPSALETLIAELARLPGIGPRTAERLAVYVLRSPSTQAAALARALSSLHASIRSCQVCHNLSETELCLICANPTRDQAVMAVVEEPLDVVAIEKTGTYKGLYHVLGGVLSPLDGIGPDQLNILSLISRLKKLAIKELIIATNPTTEGETTAIYLQKRLPKRKPEIKISRLARGLPMGSDLEYADQITLGRALEGRQQF